MTRFYLDVENDIWDTEYTLRVYSKKKATLTVPYTEWVNNSGSLNFYKVKTNNPEKIDCLKRFFLEDSMVIILSDGKDFISLADVIATMTPAKS